MPLMDEVLNTFLDKIDGITKTGEIVDFYRFVDCTEIPKAFEKVENRQHTHKRQISVVAASFVNWCTILLLTLISKPNYKNMHLRFDNNQ